MSEAAVPEDHEVLRLLPYYELGSISEADRAALESHALQCDACFAELERGAAVSLTMREHAAEALRVLEPESASLPPTTSRRYSPLPWMLPKFLVPVTASVLIVAAWMLLRPSSDYRDLASFPREPVSTSMLRGPEIRSAVRELLETGSARLDLEQYSEAERAFAAALDRDPTSGEAAYLLGLCRARQSNLQDALAPLEKAVDLSSSPLRSRAQWVLANTHLALGRLGDATALLETLAGEPGEMGVEARELLAKLPQGP